MLTCENIRRPAPSASQSCRRSCRSTLRAHSPYIPELLDKLTTRISLLYLPRRHIRSWIANVRCLPARAAHFQQGSACLSLPSDIVMNMVTGVFRVRLSSEIPEAAAFHFRNSTFSRPPRRRFSTPGGRPARHIPYSGPVDYFRLTRAFAQAMISTAGLTTTGNQRQCRTTLPAQQRNFPLTPDAQMRRKRRQQRRDFFVR